MRVYTTCPVCGAEFYTDAAALIVREAFCSTECEVEHVEAASGSLATALHEILDADQAADSAQEGP